MKLRNKKTGKVMDLECITIFDRPDRNDIGDAIDEFYTIAELNKEWEDYKPVEPLIKDDKIRRAVRAWAELHEVESVFYFAYTSHKELSYLKSIDTGVVIDIGDISELEDGEIYTIAELCGEEKE